MEKHVCLNCGAPLTKEDAIYTCPYCRATYEDDAEARASVTLKSLLDEERLDRYSRAKRVLYTAVHAKYPSSQEVLSAAQAVLAIEDQDILANVYLFSHDESPYRLNPYIASLQVAPPIADEILRWLLPSLNPRSGAAVKHFVELNYHDKDLTDRLTEVEDTIQKLDAGTYEAGMIRDVFIAYSSADMKEVVHLVDLIEENGLTCFAAFRNLRHGKGAAENYLAEIHKAMAACSVFVLVSSPHSLEATCDAVRVELPYLCAHLPDKPRIQYVIKDAPHVSFIVTRNLKAAFPSQEWCRDEEDLLTRIFDILSKPSKEEEERLRLEEERRKLEAEKARAAAEAEAERQRLERQKRQNAEEAERARAEAEAERQRLEEQRRQNEEAAERARAEVEEMRRNTAATATTSTVAPINGAVGTKAPMKLAVSDDGLLMFRLLKDNTYAVSAADKDEFRVQKLTIPASFNGIRVTAIDNEGFKFTSVKQAFLPEGLVRIGDFAFSDCTYLVSCSYPSTLESIGTCAFCNSALRSVSLPEGLKTIEDDAFASCMHLETLTIPASVETIGNGAFFNSPALTIPSLDPDSKHFTRKDSVLFSKDMSRLVFYPMTKKDTRYEVPSGVKEIAAYSFKNTYLEELIVPEGVTKIGAGAFRESFRLRKVSLPSTLEIDDYYGGIFEYCSALHSITVAPGPHFDKAREVFGKEHIDVVSGGSSASSSRTTTASSSFGGTRPSPFGGTSSGGRPRDRIPASMHASVFQEIDNCLGSSLPMRASNIQMNFVRFYRGFVGEMRGRVNDAVAAAAALATFAHFLTVEGMPDASVLDAVGRSMNFSSTEIRSMLTNYGTAAAWRESLAMFSGISPQTMGPLIVTALWSIAIDGEPTNAEIDAFLELCRTLGIDR